MASFLGMKCDFQGCDQHVSSDADFSTWWCVYNTTPFLEKGESPQIQISQMQASDFKDASGCFVCCIDHAIKLTSQHMSSMQQSSTSSEREQEGI